MTKEIYLNKVEFVVWRDHFGSYLTEPILYTSMQEEVDKVQEYIQATAGLLVYETDTLLVLAFTASTGGYIRTYIAIMKEAIIRRQTFTIRNVNCSYANSKNK